jgi:bifunctional DNA-binding transcriptional regulator/antitoxin component of YhaV-PrlF toxin-antitoxin module
MKRRLVQMGKNCLMAAIPMKWIKQHNLKKGDFLEIEEIENYLLVSSKEIQREKEISINFSDENQVAIMRVLQLLYDSGFKTIKIKYSNEKILSSVSWVINFLDGWRIKNISKNCCEIESVFQENFDFINYFRIIFI